MPATSIDLLDSQFNWIEIKKTALFLLVNSEGCICVDLVSDQVESSQLHLTALFLLINREGCICVDVVSDQVGSSQLHLLNNRMCWVVTIKRCGMSKQVAMRDGRLINHVGYCYYCDLWRKILLDSVVHWDKNLCKRCLMDWLPFSFLTCLFVLFIHHLYHAEKKQRWAR